MGSKVWVALFLSHWTHDTGGDWGGNGKLTIVDLLSTYISRSLTVIEGVLGHHGHKITTIIKS